MNSMTNGRKALLTGMALAASLGFTLSAQAQTCVVTNWTTPTQLTNANTGIPDLDATDNRRYGGPCGLRVEVDGTARFLTDKTPANETTYIARFYAFLDEAGSNPIQIFSASDGTTNQVEVWYNQDGSGTAAEGELTMMVTTTGGSIALEAGTIGDGWHSIELVWEQNANAGLVLNVDGGTDVTATADTGAAVIADASLGNILGAPSTNGKIDFDDFDSRRIDRPGRLLVSDGNADGVVDIFDALALRDELAEIAVAPGQPDCDENGLVDIFDALCLRDLTS